MTWQLSYLLIDLSQMLGKDLTLVRHTQLMTPSAFIIAYET